MPETLTLQNSVLQSPVPPSQIELDEGSSWYAVYTCARHEKRVKQQLDLRQIRCALPLYRAVHRWKDRRKELDLPLFPSYIFVNLALTNRVRVLEIPGVVSFVCSQGKPVVLPRHEVGPFLADHGAGRGIEPHPFVQVGRQVPLRNGPLAGLEGTLLRWKEGLRLVVSIDMLMRSVAVEVSAEDVEPCYRSTCLH
jgi:transcription termination/antitermination protein NusG